MSEKINTYFHNYYNQLDEFEKSRQKAHALTLAVDKETVLVGFGIGQLTEIERNLRTEAAAAARSEVALNPITRSRMMLIVVYAAHLVTVRRETRDVLVQAITEAAVPILKFYETFPDGNGYLPLSSTQLELFRKFELLYGADFDTYIKSATFF